MLEPLLKVVDICWICLIPFALFGMFLTAFNIQVMSYVQIAVDEKILGRVFSIIFTVAVFFMPLGSFVFSLFVNPENINSFYLVGGGIVLLSLASIIYHCLKKKITANQLSY